MAGTEEVANTPGSQARLGKYRLEQKLGEGGFGAVYKAYDPDLEVYRAVKIPAIQNDDEGTILKEARLQAQMTHPNLVQVHSVEQFDSKWAIVMEFLEGGSLRDRLDGTTPLSQEVALRYTVSIASGLLAAHAKNVLHHDIKPENILFDSSDVPKVADFGIARIFRETKKDMSRVLGTAAYMAPEQLEGRADLRSDVWSLGVMLYEMLSGRPCFTGDSVGEVVKNIVMARPAPLRTINRSIPRALESIVMQMIEKDPGARTQSMEEVIREIEAYRKGAKAERKIPWAAIVPLLAALACAAPAYFYGMHTGIFHEAGLLAGKGPAVTIPPAEIPEEVKALDLQARMDRADAYIGSKDYVLAYHILDTVIDEAKDRETRAQALLSRGILLSEDMNLPDEALKDFRKVIDEAPAGMYVANARYYAGWIFAEKKHDLRSAIPHLTAVIRTYPDSPMFQTAQFLAQGAARDLERQGPEPGLFSRSSLTCFLPNNISSLVMSTLGIIILISGVPASLMYKRKSGSSPPAGERIKILAAVIVAAVLCQTASFLVTSHKTGTEYAAMVQALKDSGITVHMKNR